MPLNKQYRIRFIRDEVEELAYKDPSKGGYEKVKIPAGTERDVTAAGLRFWEARGNVERIGRANPFELPREPETPVTPGETTLTKKAVGEVVLEAVKAMAESDIEKLRGSLYVLCDDRLIDVLPELLDDTKMVIRAAAKDLEDGKLDVHPQDLGDALEQVRQLTLPPSRRDRQH